MIIELNLEKDEELRNYIKSLIKSQVLSITRDELTEIIRIELDRKIKGLNEAHFNELLKQSMQAAVKQLLREEHNIKEWDRDAITPYIESGIEHVLKGMNFEFLVDRGVTAKIAKMAALTKPF